MCEVKTCNIMAFCEEIFHTEGYPEEVITDNGPQLVSGEFGNYKNEHSSGTPQILFPGTNARRNC